MTVVLGVFCEVEVPVLLRLAGEALAATNDARAIDTEQVAVPVWPSESVTVTCAVPVSVVPAASDGAVKLVPAADGVLIVMPEPPEIQDQEYVYGATPPEAVAVVVPVLSDALAPVTENEVVDKFTVTPTACVMLTETAAVVVWPSESVTVHCAVPESVLPAASEVVLKVVVAAVAESIVIPAPPLDHPHAYV